MIDRERYPRIRQALLAWYAATARDLPWRRTKDPYAIWISEIMLQQTRVPAAVPYYDRFLKRFPTVRHLARARLDTVLKLWEGLGYYSRARNLHAAAREIVARFGGEVPRTRDELLTLPGIGRYTAGAIASIAFGRAGAPRGRQRRAGPVPGLSHPRQPQGHRDPQEALVHRRGPVAQGPRGQFNQALMELGSEICTPRNPRCEICP